MPVDIKILQDLTKCPAKEAWRILIDGTLSVMSKPLSEGNASEEIMRRDREIGVLDLFLSSVGWDLWGEFGNAVERTSDRLKKWWNEPYDAKAILILDGLSLRELPLLTQGAEKHGFSVRFSEVTASELPGETNEFAKALGFSSRSQLQNKGGKSVFFPDANTDSVGLPWMDCSGLLDSSKNWIFWHHWPDDKIHQSSGAGAGLVDVAQDAEAVFGSDDFWTFAGKLAKGRRLIVTSDHGYAFTGHFSDSDNTVGGFLKEKFSSGRNAPDDSETGPFAPPVALRMEGVNGSHLMALGQRKWKSPGGYPVLTHGGLSLLEVLSPFIELSKSEGA
jgi:hypothetical protein